MSTYIGTNFGYNGQRYLDDRQGKAETTEDLRGWSTLIPVGFKVWLDGQWYFYDPSLPKDTLTGDFHKFFADSFEDTNSPGLSSQVVRDEIGKIYDYTEDLESRVFPLTLEYITPSQTNYTGSKVLPEIIWRVSREGKDTVPDEVTINGSSVGVDLYAGTWKASEEITEDAVYDVIIRKKSGVVTARVEFRFSNPRFWGVSEYSEMTGTRIPGLGNEDWNETNAIPATVYDCEGGKYPWIAIPSDIWQKHKETRVWIGGLMTSDINTYRVDVRNPEGKEVEYTCFRLGNIQTGSDLVIELK